MKAAVLALVLAVAPLSVTNAAASTTSTAQLDRLETQVVRAEDLRAIRKLQRAYGYYADRGLWDDLADLFTEDAVANYPSGGFDGNASIRAMFVQNLGQGKTGLAEGRIYNHTILQPVVDLAADGATATGRWRVLGMLGRFGGSATWADSLYRFDYVKQDGQWKIKVLTAYAGSGGGYADGWVLPKPRPPGAADTSPIRFNLAHPADRPWIDPCEEDTSACVVPFPYANRGRLRPPANPAAVFAAGHSTDAGTRGADLIRRAQRLADEQAVLNLQRAYGYYVDRGLWRQASDLFAPQGTREVGQAGVYVGREHIRRALALDGPEGLRAGQLNDHLQIEPIVDVAADGRSAQGRIFELAFVGGGGTPARIEQSVQENAYVRRNGVWMIASMHVYTILATAYEQGWGKSALPVSQPSKVLPPDRPPTVVYAAYPSVFTPRLHFDNAATGRPTQYAAGTGESNADGTDTSFGDEALATTRYDDLSVVSRQVQRVLDGQEIDNLQSAYGYYAEKSLWPDIVALFTRDGVLEIDAQRYVGSDRILAYLKSLGPQGPVKGALNSQLQLQPVIDVAADGHSAKVRSRLLQLARDAKGRPLWGGGIYESELVKDNGVWKFRHLHLYRTYRVDYKAGWVNASAADGWLLPTRVTPPFHYVNPVSAR
ncbi:MAG: nuclear transport factor 2 family protein [Pseudomonadota bacterium]